MKQWKTIYAPKTAFGGWEFRVTSDGETVHVQQRHATNTTDAYHTARVMTLAAWGKFSDEWDLENPYNDNPAPVSRLANLDYDPDQEEPENE